MPSAPDLRRQARELDLEARAFRNASAIYLERPGDFSRKIGLNLRNEAEWRERQALLLRVEAIGAGVREQEQTSGVAA